MLGESECEKEDETAFACVVGGEEKELRIGSVLGVVVFMEEMAEKGRRLED